MVVTATTIQPDNIQASINIMFEIVRDTSSIIITVAQVM